ncbi:MAG: HAD family hydrolase [Chitinophagaceae bacterium]
MNITQYDVILWDFDGVLMDSMPVRSLGFEYVLKDYPKNQIEDLLAFHDTNGGLSRYVKFKYFFEEIRKESITEEQIIDLAKQFSEVMMSLLVNPVLLIDDTLNFVKENYNKFSMHIVSGSDGTELNEICKRLDIAKYFKSIHGSPTPKKELVATLLEQNKYNRAKVVLIGDSINDLEAAEANHITFGGYNNKKLRKEKGFYITSFSNALDALF